MSELRALGALAAHGFRGLTQIVEDLHTAVATRAFTGVGPLGAVPRAMHAGIARAVYASVRGVGGGILASAGLAAACAAPQHARAISSDRRGALGLGVLNGFLGDRLAAEGNPLAIEPGIRVGGELVPAEPAALAAAFPGATPRVAVFLHGLCETEDAWRLGERTGGAQTYGAMLARERGFTPLFVRYNTGLHIADNGRTLAGLLSEVVAHWPVRVAEIVLVGHSMGGLVIRSACHAAVSDGAAWPPLVSHAVYLGSPHLGAPLAAGAHAASQVLRAVPETHWLSAVLEARSDGIRDLRHGLVADEPGPGAPSGGGPPAAAELPLLAGARHHAVSASLARSSRNPADRLLGDLLVIAGSSSGRGWRGRRVPFDPDDCCDLPGVHHFALLNHPAVHDLLRGWIGGAPVGGEGAHPREARV